MDAELSVDSVLAELLSQGRSRAGLMDSDHDQLWNALEESLAGGKRSRPAMVAVAHECFGGRSPAAVASIGAAIELLHTAFVIHDDVIDGDDIRRGRLNVSGSFRADAVAVGADADGAHALGVAAGIVAGDLALATALRAVALCGAPAATVARLLDEFDKALHITAAGEVCDVRLSLNVAPASLDDSLAMARAKTSAYSFSLPLTAGALLADAPSEAVERCDRVGEHLGLAFQLVDDLLGVFGDPALTKKSTRSDLSSSKQTPLLVHARSTAQWPQISSYLGRDLDDEELAQVRMLLTASGSRRFVEEMIKQQISQARAVGDPMRLPTQLYSMVTDCLSQLVDVQDQVA